MQGANRWSYIDGDTNQPMSEYHAAGTFSECGSDPCWRGSQAYMLVKPTIQSPGNETNGLSLRRWRAPRAGSAHIITGTIKHVGGTCSDGVGIQIRKNTSAFWASPHWLPAGGQDSLDEKVSVNEGDAIDFIVLKGQEGSNNSCDWTFFDPKIEFTPTPADTGSITVRKAFLDVPKNDVATRVRLNGNTFQTGKKVVFGSVAPGSHTISVEVPAGMKAFWAICPETNEACYGPVEPREGISGPGVVTTSTFTHSSGENDSITIFFTPPDMEYGFSIIPFKRFQIFNDAHAVSGIVPGRGSWRDDMKDEYSVSPLSCSRHFTLLDPTVSEQLFSLADTAVDTWTANTYAKPTLFRDVSSVNPENKKGARIPYTVINEKAVYKVDDVAKWDSTNFVAYTDKYNKNNSWDEVHSDGAAVVYGFGRFSIPNNEENYEPTPYIKNIIGTDIIFNPALTLSSRSNLFRQRAFTHEFGHAIGLGHTISALSVMNEFGNDRSDVITAADIQAVNALYETCAPGPAVLDITLTPEPLGARAATWHDQPKSAQCVKDKRVYPNGWWRGILDIRNSGKSDIVRLDTHKIELFEAGKSTPRYTKESTINWGPFRKGRSAGYAYQVRPRKDFVPSRVRVTFSGVDELGNKVTDNSSMDLEGGERLSKNPCSGGGSDFPVFFISGGAGPYPYPQ